MEVTSPAGSAGTAAPAVAPQASPFDVQVDAQVEVLRNVTRHMTTAEDLATVLRSITGALVERADAAVARVFLVMEDRECDSCRARIDAGAQTEMPGPALHLASSSGSVGGDEFLHRAPLDSRAPVAVALRHGVPSLVADWRALPPEMLDPRIARVWTENKIVSAAAYPLVFQGESLGAIGYVSRRGITQAEFEVLGIFADQAAMAIRSAYLFRELHTHKEQLQEENAYLQEEIRSDCDFTNIIGESPALQAVLRKVRKVAGVETTVLLTGETGTGKELIARAIHDGSPRKERPLIKVNCGAIPQGVVESELFGHEKGAFTGALQQRIGRFELADKGTLFMDEVGELPLETQVKLLRVLQEREFERVGSTRAMHVDVRLVAATNRNLEQEVAAGKFRADLFYRLNVFPVRVPPLRERVTDIPLLVRHILTQLQRKLAKPLKDVTPEAMEQLKRYPWPGNIRELQNVLERAAVLATGPIVSLAEPLRTPTVRTETPAGALSIADGRLETMEESERAHIRRALSEAGGKVHGPQGAAAMLGVNSSTLRSRMQKLGVDPRAR